MEKIKQLLKDKYENHIFPLFWQHGENEVVLREYMDKIEQSGIKAVCVEARPHPEFVGKKWWSDMDCIIEEAKNRDMKIWILDDSHFPTGFANGEIRDKFPHLKKRFLKVHQLDFVGPMKAAKAIIKFAFQDKDDKLVGAVLGKKVNFKEVDSETLIDITKTVIDKKTVSFDLPEGEWRLIVLVETYTGGEKQTQDYLNPIDPEATDVLIDAVYETHYEKYKDEFGKTILGFFSDEPRFGNIHGALGSIGRNEMVLPWRKDMVEQMDNKLGFSSLLYLPLLFVDGGNKAHEMRYAYMDLVSELYSVHFNQRIGKWCEEHKVDYIGHTIEDNNAHSRLGYGAGHFFRAMQGQHMAGIDVVLHQLLPGMDNGYFKAMTSSGWDGEFFHYVLGKLGSSLGHIDPKKNGRVMCEVFGAYGWSEGIRMMKWITDYMLVRGVNEFVPHAFNPKQYPDNDCPPHFYAHGKNPQYNDFKILMNYMNRMSDLLSKGIHRAPIGLIYHGEAEWAGEYMLMQKPAALLTRNQIDFDILPIDTLLKASMEKNRLKVNKEVFRGLVVPYAEALPKVFIEKLLMLAKLGLKIYILNEFPCRASNGEEIKYLIQECQNEANINVIPLEQLVSKLKKDNLYEIEADSYEPYLRYYHYEHEDGQVFMFTNEHPYNEISTNIMIPLSNKCYIYDALENKINENINAVMQENKTKLSISLQPYESMVVVFTNEKETNYSYLPIVLEKQIELKNEVKVSFAKEQDYPQFSNSIIVKGFASIEELQSKEEFAGIIRYETEFEIDNIPNVLKLKINGVYETAKVWINGKLNGVKICPPYSYDITNGVYIGKNTLIIEVTTTLVRENYDWLSQFMILEPIGINDSVVLEYYK